MRTLMNILLLSLSFVMCKHTDKGQITSSDKIDNEYTNPEDKGITCDNNDCNGEYIGPEFIDRSDVAHQFYHPCSPFEGTQT